MTDSTIEFLKFLGTFLAGATIGFSFKSYKVNQKNINADQVAGRDLNNSGRNKTEK